MVIEFKWNNKTYKVVSYGISLQSGGATQLADCIPSMLNLSLELPPTASPAKDFLNFARTQHANAKTKGKGQITVFKGRDDHKEGQAIQTIKFDKAWFSDISTSSSIHDDKFMFNINFVLTEIEVSGEKFEHHSRKDFFSE